MAEETTNSVENAPKGIIYTVLVSGIFGMFYYICLLFACTDIDAVVSGSTDDTSVTLTGYASTNIFILACGQQGGAGLTWLIVINLFLAGVASVAVTGRITYALMRDNLFAGSSYFSSTTESTASPFAAITLVCVIDLLLQLLPLNVTNGNVAFLSILGLCNLGFYVSYGLPVALKLYYQPKDFPVTKVSTICHHHYHYYHYYHQDGSWCLVKTIRFHDIHLVIWFIFYILFPKLLSYSLYHTC